MTTHRLHDDDPDLAPAPDPDPYPDDDSDTDAAAPDDDDDDDDSEDVVFEDDHLLEPEDSGETDPDAETEDPAEEQLTAQSPLPTVRHARLGDLRVEYKHWVNPRSLTGLGEDKIREVAASIRARTITGDDGTVIVGITDPIKIVPILNATGGADLLIIDGQRRYLASCTIFDPPGDELVPVIYLAVDPIDKWTADLANHYFVEALHGVGTREGLSAYELSEAAVRLRDTKDPGTGKVYTLSAIAAVLNRSESWVSKILTARGNASDALLSSWRRGEMTEEQFRDLAVVKDKAKQKAQAAEIVTANKTGARGESRALAKSEKLIARQEEAKAKPAKEPLPTKTEGKKTTVVRGPQAELPVVVSADKPAPESRKPRAMALAVVDDIITTAEKYPPTHDMVRGIILGIKVAAGLADTATLPKPWQSYLTLVATAQQRGRKEHAKPEAKAKKKPVARKK